MFIKALSVFFLFILACQPTHAQEKRLSQKMNAPFALRIDLLQNTDQVHVNSRFPSFSWAIADSAQLGYQILVASKREWLMHNYADVWNSGQKAGSSNTGIVYSGPALRPSTIYYWKVRTWPGGKQPTHYSDPQSFCTGTELEDNGLPSFALIKTLQLPATISQLDNNGILFDFGKDGFSQIKALINAQGADDTLIIHLGEALTPDGHVDRAPPGSVRYRMIKVPLSQGRQWYTPVIQPDKRNTAKNAILMPADIGEVLPFRYAEITTIPGKYRIDSVARYWVTSPFDDAATTFTSSDPALNKIWDLCKYTIRATSFSGYYVDGDRERIPYEADALINQLSHYACDAEFAMAKRTLDYLIDHPTWPTEWSLQNILIAWNDYLYSGDPQLVRKIYPDLKAKLLGALAREDGLISTRTGKQTPDFLRSIHYHSFNGSNQLRDIVDWPPTGGVDGKTAGVMGETDGFVFADYNAVVNAYYYEGLELMAKLAKAVNNEPDAAYYSREADRVKTAFQHTFFDPKTNLVVDGEGVTHSSLHASCFALAFDLVPKEKIAPVLAFIHSRGMACSVYGAQFLMDGLAQVNDPDYALQLLTSTEKRSWFNMLKEGATMTMEAWGQEYKPNQDWCHAWGTAPANYIVRHFAGIQPLSPGFASIRIKPQPGTVAHATLRYRTIRGDIGEEFDNTSNRFALQLTLPGNTIGQVYLPFRSEKAILKMDGRIIKAVYKDGYFQIPNVRAGKHTFDISKREPA